MRQVWFHNKLTMNDTYTRLCGHDRKVIANMAQAGNNQKTIAEVIGRSQGTVSKELRRNRGQRGYRPVQADHLAREQQAGKRSRLKVVVGVVKQEVEALLRIKHRPEQIGNVLKLNGLDVSHATIYYDFVCLLNVLKPCRLTVVAFAPILNPFAAQSCASQVQFLLRHSSSYDRQ